MAQNQISNGEMWMKNPAALPSRGCFHRKTDVDQDWYLRNAGRERNRPNVDVLYYNESPLLKKHFNAGSIGKDHSRRVFQELVQFNRSHSEGTLQAFREDKELQKDMARRYKQVMRSKPSRPAPPPPLPRPAGAAAQGHSASQKLPPMREAVRGEDGQPVQPAASSSTARRPQVAERGVVGDKAATMPRAEDNIGQSLAEASAFSPTLKGEGLQPGVDSSTVSRCRPSASMASGIAPARSQVSACPPAPSHVSVAQPDSASAAHPSQLSVSDFYSWRPRFIS